MSIQALVRNHATWDRLEWLAMALACTAAIHWQVESGCAFGYPLGPDGRLTRKSDQQIAQERQRARAAHEAECALGVFRLHMRCHRRVSGSCSCPP